MRGIDREKKDDGRREKDMEKEETGWKEKKKEG